MCLTMIGNGSAKCLRHQGILLNDITYASFLCLILLSIGRVRSRRLLKGEIKNLACDVHEMRALNFQWLHIGRGSVVISK